MEKGIETDLLKNLRVFGYTSYAGLFYSIERN